MFKGLDDVEKLKSIHMTGTLIEEASEIFESVSKNQDGISGGSDFTQLDLRLRGNTPSYKQHILCLNPVSESSWVKKYFFDREIPNSRIILSTFRDNKFIDPEYKRALEALKYTNRAMWLVYSENQWGIQKGQIFTNYIVSDNISTDPDDYPLVVRAIDFGYNDPSAYIIAAFDDSDPNNKKCYVLHEFYRRKLTNDELIKVVSNNQSKHDLLICDSAEPQRIESFKRVGFTNVKGVKKGKGSIRQGIQGMLSWQIIVHSSCTNLLRELSGYKWGETKSGESTDSPADNQEDHAIDSLRYCFSVVNKRKKLKAGLPIF